MEIRRELEELRVKRYLRKRSEIKNQNAFQHIEGPQYQLRDFMFLQKSKNKKKAWKQKSKKNNKCTFSISVINHFILLENISKTSNNFF